MIQDAPFLTQQDVKDRVSRGARYMDRVDPGWYKPGVLRRVSDPESWWDVFELVDGEGIDLDRFDIGSCDRCILGQRMSNYSDAVAVWERNFVASGRLMNDGLMGPENAALARARRLGFDKPRRDIVEDGEDPYGSMPVLMPYEAGRVLLQRLWEIEIETRRAGVRDAG